MAAPTRSALGGVGRETYFWTFAAGTGVCDLPALGSASQYYVIDVIWLSGTGAAITVMQIDVTDQSNNIYFSIGGTMANGTLNSCPLTGPILMPAGVQARINVTMTGANPTNVSVSCHREN